MAIFKSKTKEIKPVAPSAEAKPAMTKSSRVRAPRSTASVLRRPRITEKAANMTAENVYTFDIDMRATKKEVMDAVKALYKVTPIKVNVVNTPATRVRLKKKRGFGNTAAYRKAYVFLKKGDEIQLA
jgi:large subunit ribosomal protein L23